jgi:23S rRNA pseudouridine2605 synthase
LSACPTPDDFARLRSGIRLEDGMSAPARARVLEKLKMNAWVEIEVHEGRKREVRRIFEALGYFVEKLIRVKVGSVVLGSLPPGELRPLNRSEVDALKREVGLLADHPRNHATSRNRDRRAKGKTFRKRTAEAQRTQRSKH